MRYESGTAMPRRREPWISGEFYRVYNRGVNRQPVFQDAADYGAFLIRVRHYLLGQRQDGIGEAPPEGGTHILA